ncbi:MAG: 30S ribosomal protein S16 [Patescibacteria group bacterium]|nr:30S ribosomal protein S16 [Patescibacteria group bacterium]
MLTIRLQRIGKRKQPTYRFIISEKHRDTQYNSLEILGNYNPTQNPKVLELKKDRIKHWLSVGAQTSNTVHNIFVREGLIEGKKKKSVTITAKRKVKIEAKKADVIAKEKTAKEAATAAEEAKKVAAAEKSAEETATETPVEEAKA